MTSAQPPQAATPFPVLFRHNGAQVIERTPKDEYEALESAVNDYQSQGLTEPAFYWLIISNNYVCGTRDNPGIYRITVQKATRGFRTYVDIVLVAIRGFDPTVYQGDLSNHKIPGPVQEAFTAHLHAKSAKLADRHDEK